MQEEAKLGEGIFLIRDVANILRVKYEKAYRLVMGFWHSRSFGDDRNKAVNFYALIEIYVYHILRNGGLSAHGVKKLHIQLAEELNTKYPFAHKYIINHSENNISFHKINYGSNGLAKRVLSNG